MHSYLTLQLVFTETQAGGSFLNHNGMRLPSAVLRSLLLAHPLWSTTKPPTLQEVLRSLCSTCIT